ncbi:MAG: acetylornithine carbamoyltransferase [Flavobacteriales bacterium AspAUS03]
MKQFISVDDVPDLHQLIEKTRTVKRTPFAFKDIGRDKTIGLVFFNPSLRTRLSSQKAAFNLGASTWVLNIDHDSWKIEMDDGTVMENSQEHIKEAIAVMSLYCNILAVRTFPSLFDRDFDYHEVLFNKIKYYSKVPMVSLESATLHPLQSLSDVMTIEELRPAKERIKIVLSWAPHVKALPHSVPNSFAQWASKLQGAELVITHPEGYALDEQFSRGARIIHDQDEAFKGADFIYAKNWSSFTDYGKLLCRDTSWMISREKMVLTDRAKFMHCLPVRRNVVVEDVVLDGEETVVLQQAENRVFAAQTVFMEILKNMM